MGDLRDMASYRRYPIWPMEGIPSQWINRDDPDYEESIFQAPTFTLDPTMTGEIRRPEHLRKGLRGLMKEQMRRRAAARAKDEVDELGKFLRDLLSGVWWHARRSPFPEEEMVTMASMRRRGTLFGEPVGTSLTKHPSKIEEGFGPELIRAMPEFSGDPLAEVLFHQYRPHAEVMNQNYIETIMQIAEESPNYARELGRMESYGDLRNIIPAAKFNERLTRNLEAKGYRGVSYSPSHRYEEYELKMFPGKAAPGMASDWVWPIDMRSGSREGRAAVERWDRMVGSKLRKAWREKVATAPYHHLHEHYREIDLKDVARQIREKHGIEEISAPTEADDFWEIEEMLTPEWAKKATDKIAEIENNATILKGYIGSGKGTYDDALDALGQLENMTGLEVNDIMEIADSGNFQLLIDHATKAKK